MKIIGGEERLKEIEKENQTEEQENEWGRWTYTPCHDWAFDCFEEYGDNKPQSDVSSFYHKIVEEIIKNHEVTYPCIPLRIGTFPLFTLRDEEGKSFVKTVILKKR